MIIWLSRQVSNLNSSDPESDVLPITPRDNFEVANIEKPQGKSSLRKFSATTQKKEHGPRGGGFLITNTEFSQE